MFLQVFLKAAQSGSLQSPSLYFFMAHFLFYQSICDFFVNGFLEDLVIRILKHISYFSCNGSSGLVFR